MKVPFWKLSGAGNDFVLLEGLPRGRSGPALARKLCDRRRGIGADGLLAARRRTGGLALGYWNADGSAAFCGNGARCAAIHAVHRRWVKGRELTLWTGRGRLEAVLTGKDRASVTMPVPKRLKLDLELSAGGRVWAVSFVDTGVPHAVVFVDDAEKIDVKSLGRELRFHKAFGRAGANVDFVQVHRGTLILRTYERGVEDETLACGTGVMAAAAVARAMGKGRDSFRVAVRGGATLRVDFADKVRLEGPVERVFSGEATL